MNHIAHLRSETLLLGERGEFANLADVVAKRLFEINGEAVVGRGNYDGVHLALHLVEHFAVVHERRRVGVGVFAGVAEAVRTRIDIAVGNQLLLQALHNFHIRPAHQTAADKADSNRVFDVGFVFLGLVVGCAPNDRYGAANAAALAQLTSRKNFLLDSIIYIPLSVCVFC